MLTSCNPIPTGKIPDTPVDDGSMLIGTWKQIDRPVGEGGTYYQGNHYFSTAYADETYVFHSNMTFSHTIIGTVRKFYSDEKRLHEIELPEYENSTVNYFAGESGTFTYTHRLVNNELQYYEPFWSEDYKFIDSSLAILGDIEIFSKQ